MGVGRAHVIWKLERRGSQPPAFLGHFVAWYHHAVWFSYRVQAPRLVVIIGRISGIGAGVLYIAKTQSLLLASVADFGVFARYINCRREIPKRDLTKAIFGYEVMLGSRRCG